MKRDIEALFDMNFSFMSGKPEREKPSVMDELMRENELLKDRIKKSKEKLKTK